MLPLLPLLPPLVLLISHRAWSVPAGGAAPVVALAVLPQLAYRPAARMPSADRMLLTLVVMAAWKATNAEGLVTGSGMGPP